MPEVGCSRGLITLAVSIAPLAEPYAPRNESVARLKNILSSNTDASSRTVSLLAKSTRCVRAATAASVPAGAFQSLNRYHPRCRIQSPASASARPWCQSPSLPVAPKVSPPNNWPARISQV